MAVAIADRHYNRQKVGTPQFVPPGPCIVLLGPQALWVTSWPYAQFVQHDWGGAWLCSIFRNEGDSLSSELITAAVAATRAVWTPPELGIVTFVDRTKVKSTNPGFCFLKAGWTKVGLTKGGLIVYQQLPQDMPSPSAPEGVYRLLLHEVSKSEFSKGDSTNRRRRR